MRDELNQILGLIQIDRRRLIDRHCRWTLPMRIANNAQPYLSA